MLKIDGALLAADLARAGGEAKRLEELGYDGAFTFEGPHDPFYPLLLAARETSRLELATAIAIAFARTPMLLATLGQDLHTFSQGRFILGLGSQIRPHIERRFSMPWSKPADRMRELVLAIRAIWRCWNQGEKLDFRGDFYTCTLMTPFFNPGPGRWGAPRIFLAGVGPRMTEVAGEVADGFFVHPFHTRESLERLTLPALERGLVRAGRSRADLQVSHQVLIATGERDEELARARAAVRSQIAFYGSTPAYRPVLESRGWGDLQPELNLLSKRGKWTEMSGLISEEMLEAIAVCAPPGQLAARLRERTRGVSDRLSLVAPWAPDPARWSDLIRELRSDPQA
jgi:probable F420-dependent oxidoreductase